jgi:ParB family chromosome partitioning protein
VKKNRRGLGRGLGALIQSTVPEDEAPESGESSLDRAGNSNIQEADSAPSELRQVDMPEETSHGTPSATELPADAQEMKSPEVGEPDVEDSGLAPKVTSAEDVAGDIADRYLGHEGSTGTGQTAPTEARRPVDLFFPDRRSESTSGSTEKQQPDRRAPASNGRKRPTMPPMEPRALRTSRATKEKTEGNGSAQPVDVDSRFASTSSVGADDARPDAPATETRFFGNTHNAELRSIPVTDIHPNPRQPREVFDEDDMDELVASIKEVGVLQPIVVRPVAGPSPYELVMGERRWRASQRAGLSTMPAIVRHTADTALLRDALLENLHRSQLNPLEEAAAYEQLLEDFDCTQDELSNRIGRSRPQISNTLRLLKLPPLVQRRVASGVLSAGHARALLGLVDPAEMEKLAQKIVSEGLSVRATEELVSLHDGIRQAKPKSRSPRTERHERLDYLANSLTDQLDTTVKITLGARKGKIAIDFASVEDLNRIMTLINPSGSNSVQP